MRYEFVLDNGGEQVELTKATSRHVTWRLDDNADAGFSIDGRHAQAGAITELSSDLVVRIDGEDWYRGTVGPTNDALSGTKHAVQVSTADYRARLRRRILYSWNTLSVAGIDQFDLAWALVQATQGNPGGYLGIERGIGVASGVLRDRTYDVGQNVGVALDQLGRVIDGFEWEIDANRQLNQWYPRRGQAKGVVLSHGGNVRSVQRQVDVDAYFTGLRLNGADGLAAEEREFGAGAELLTENEASLETDTTGWGASTNATIARSTLYADEATASLELTSVAAGDMQSITSATASPNVNVGDVVTIRARVRAPDGAGTAGTLRYARVRAQWRTGADGGGATVGTTNGVQVLEVEGRWVNVSLVATVPDTAVSVRLIVSVIGTGAAGETHYFDRMSVRVSSLGDGERWDRQIGETSILLQDTLAERADLLIEDGPVLQPAYVVTLAPGVWGGPGHIWLGDTVRLNVRSLPRLDVDADMRVYEVAIVINSSNRGVVQLVLNAPRPDFSNRLPNLSRRLTDLERR